MIVHKNPYTDQGVRLAWWEHAQLGRFLSTELNFAVEARHASAYLNALLVQVPGPWGFPPSIDQKIDQAFKQIWSEP